jgi:hypothetical protein
VAGIVHGTPGADSFTIETRGGATETVDVTSPWTAHYERGVASPSLANVANGDFVVAFGPSNTTANCDMVVHVQLRSDRGPLLTLTSRPPIGCAPRQDSYAGHTPASELESRGQTATSLRSSI